MGCGDYVKSPGFGSHSEAISRWGVRVGIHSHAKYESDGRGRRQLWCISLSPNLHIPQLFHLQEGRPEQRNLNDSAALAAKVAKKAEMKQKQEEEALRAASTTPVVRKKVTTKKDEDLDALLSVGLPGKKK